MITVSAMQKTMFIGGYGPGISNAVAERFGREGFSIALSGRTKARLDEGVAHLGSKGIKAQAFVAELSDPAIARKTVAAARAALGSISVLQWTAASPAAANLLTAPLEEVNAVLNLAIVSVVAAIQEALPDLRAQKGAVLLTNGGLGLFDDTLDTYGQNAMGLSVGNSAKHKLSRVLAKQLATEGIYLGEVMVAGTVKGTTWDKGNATLDPATIGTKFWELYAARTQNFALVRG
jgi:NAD(P)-dependent dehydrogenase (short-subunit alcohol dehydrogenase family)